MKEKVIVGLTASRTLAKEIAKLNDLEYYDSRTTMFADGETRTSMEPAIKGKDVYLIQSTHTPVNDNMMELLIGIDAAKRLGVNSINVVIPYYGYARQDRLTRDGRPISSQLKANLIKAAGADKVFLVDIHSTASLDFYNGDAQNISAIPYLAEKTKGLQINNLVVVSPDKGGVERARKAADVLGTELVIINKIRTDINVAVAQDIDGDVKDKNVILVDDMVDTAGTISTAIKMLKEHNAKDIYVMATHALLSDKDKKTG
jgi:ribose-phosphate pyrophosphokinase